VGGLGRAKTGTVLRTGLYNRHLATLGGGERYSLAIAAELSRHGPVDVISHTSVSHAAIAERLRLDLSDVRLRVVPERPAAALTGLSAEYDFFINGSNLDFIPPQSRHSALVVYFPVPAQRGAAGALRRRLRRQLAEQFLLPTWREGIYGESAVGEGVTGARLLAPQAMVELPPKASGCNVHFCLRSAIDAVQQVMVAVDGAPVLSLAVGPQFFIPCRVRLPDRGGLPHTIAIVTESAGHSTPFALELHAWRVHSVRNELYREWFAPRLPGWDSRLLNPQPDDIVSVAAGYKLIWAISQFTQRWIGRYWGLPSALLYPPVDVEQIACECQEARNPYILSVGRFFAGQHNKQHLAMIAAFRRLVDAGLVGWDLRLVGGVTPGTAHARYLEQVRARAKGYPIHIEAGLPFDQLVQRYREAAIYWHAAGYGVDEQRAPIKAEHFGITTVEAMAAGCVPVVLGRGGQPELVTHGVDGFLWQTLDELGAYTLALVKNEERRRSMATAAALAARRFDNGHFAATLAETLAAAHIPAITPGMIPA
jgi:glycosyltransferase involved in cell wall biosynthesis